MPYYVPNYYQPNYQQNYQPTYQQPIQQNYQPTVQNQSGIIWVSSENDALAYPVAPNNAVTLWNTMEPVVYLKQADATGKPTLKIYDLIERTKTASKPVSDKDSTLPGYATKDDLNAVVGVVKGFDEIIGGIRADIDTIKGDMYGIAGKKKTARKPKEEDEE